MFVGGKHDMNGNYRKLYLAYLITALLFSFFFSVLSTVSYVRRTRQHQWRCSDVTFHCANQALCEQWIQVINEQLTLFTNRPKSLLVYINPYGGKRHGKRIYEQKVAPLFRCARISADVIGRSLSVAFLNI
uniref:DAGKc domain-containing protein n=1 Tax=Lates calcarifer TaxID=8187 RepID=A0A4W6E7F3_LATCA